MRYRDKQGNAISRERWRELYRDRDYAILRTETKGDLYLVTSWVGLQADDEDQPALFLVQAFRSGSILEESWHPNSYQALQRHAALLNPVSPHKARRG